MKRWAAVVSILLSAVAVLVGSPAASAAPFCGISWGSLARHAVASGLPGDLVDVRAGRHACYDRLVLDVAGGSVGGYHVAYVDEVSEEGSGFAVPLRGEARLAITAAVPDHDDEYEPTYRPANRAELVAVGGWRTFRQVAYAGSFEGSTTIGLGVRARLPFRVLVLDGPGSGSRLVVDVVHRW